MEHWKEIEGYDGRYMVSSEGRVGRILLSDNSSTYARVTLYKGRKGRPGASPRVVRLVHRLVARAFLGKPKVGQTEVDHKDFDRLNNRADNLRWCTRDENAAWGKGRRKGQNKIPDEMEKRIVEHYKVSKNQSATGRHFGYRQCTVHRVLERRGVL